MTTQQNRISIYPNDIELKFIKREALQNFRNNISGYIMHLVQEKMKNAA